MLGLAGQCDLTHFENLCRGLHPVSGEKLMVRNKGVSRRVCYFGQVSPPKDVSILHLVGGDQRIAGLEGLDGDVNHERLLVKFEPESKAARVLVHPGPRGRESQLSTLSSWGQRGLRQRRRCTKDSSRPMRRHEYPAGRRAPVTTRRET